MFQERICFRCIIAVQMTGGFAQRALQCTPDTHRWVVGIPRAAMRGAWHGRRAPGRMRCDRRLSG